MTQPSTIRTHHIDVDATFSLDQAATFGFGSREPGDSFDGTMTLAFACDGGVGHVAAALTQPDPHQLVVRLAGTADDERALAQVRRILSLDHDGAAWLDVGRRDPIIGTFQARLPGMRPVLFHSPWEGGLWALISSRTPKARARALLTALSTTFGATIELDGHEHVAAPQPASLTGEWTLPGLAEVRRDRIRSLAIAAADGQLDAHVLAAMPHEDAMRRLLALPGVGTFTAGLMLVRAAGVADALAADEPRTVQLVADWYPPADDGSPASLDEVSEAWRPFRTWAMVLLHVAARRGMSPDVDR